MNVNLGRSLHNKIQFKRYLNYNVGGLLKFAPPNVCVIQCTGAQAPLIKKFLFKYYLAHDPLLKANGVNKEKALLDFWLKDMKTELTLLAIEKNTGKVLGVANNGVVTKESAKAGLKDSEALKDPKLSRIASFFADVTEKAKLFERFGIENYLECYLLATHPSAQKSGIARYLVLHSLAMAKSGGFPLLRMDCTNDNSARIAKRLGMEMVPRRQIVDYVDKEGKPWLTIIPPPPNHHLDVYFARLTKGLCSKLPPPKPEIKKKKRFFFF